MRLWGGRFEGTTDERVAEFTRSIEVDGALALDDIAGSIAHVHGLGRAGLLAPDEVETLVRGLEGLRREVESGSLKWDPALEDVHLNLEQALRDRVGPIAGQIHTGRSRNDQVATDLRMWLRRTIDGLDEAVLEMERALVGLAERDGEAVLPGAHAHTAGPTGAARPSPAGVRGDARARQGPARRLPAPGQPLASRAPVPSPGPAIRSIAKPSPRSLASTG